ncbi:MAG: SCO family protein [Gammaproteobacteria bacterium]|jgi:protein SCO1/2
MPVKRRNVIGLLIALGLATATALIITGTHTPIPDIKMPGVRIFSEPVAIKPFELKDHNGETFNLDRLEGQWNVLFFGYTHCPDVCPTTLAVIDRVAGRLPDSLQNTTQFVFVSVDPYRDTLDKLKEYVSYFNPSLLGVTGSKANIDQLAQQVGAIYDFEDANTHELIRDTATLGPDRNYLVGHFAGLIIIDPEARLIAHILPPHDPDKIIDVLSRLRKVE